MRPSALSEHEANTMKTPGLSWLILEEAYPKTKGWNLVTWRLARVVEHRSLLPKEYFQRIEGF